ncbi:hypothetical protein DFJ74DRAFT_160255 [Hyaloraphidium curvatum]|nr:hypothetical protein DFJ74DRAFT_160255 [Hyaloraphidium curvatum]
MSHQATLESLEQSSKKSERDWRDLPAFPRDPGDMKFGAGFLKTIKENGMLSHRSYYTVSIQQTPMDILAADTTFKTANRRFKPNGIANVVGKFNINDHFGHMVHASMISGQSHDDYLPMLLGLRQRMELNNMPPPRLVNIDSVAAEASLWVLAFPELEGLDPPPRILTTGLPTLKVEEKNIVVIADAEHAIDTSNFLLTVC